MCVNMSLVIDQSIIWVFAPSRLSVEILKAKQERIPCATSYSYAKIDALAIGTGYRTFLADRPH